MLFGNDKYLIYKTIYRKIKKSKKISQITFYVNAKKNNEVIILKYDVL